MANRSNRVRRLVGGAVLGVAGVAWIATTAAAQAPAAKPAAPQAGKDGIVRFPNIEIDVKAKQVRVEGEVLNPEMPLEFFAVTAPPGPDHEALIRTTAKPSQIHAGLLMLGLEPGAPLTFSPATEKWTPPHGPPLHMSVRWTDKAGKVQEMPASRWMRSVKSKKEMPTITFVFTGSKVMEDGVYAADATGYLASIVNFELTPIDVPELKSSSNETLEWEFNPDTVPPAGTKATLIIEPAGAEKRGDAGAAPGAASGTTPVATNAPTTNPSAQIEAAVTPAAGAQIDVGRLRDAWTTAVTPHAAGLRQAAQTHYEVVRALRKEQQRLIDEADKIQRVIDQLEREYQDLTTPRPGDTKPAE
jgi:hypothetical protein